MTLLRADTPARARLDNGLTVVALRTSVTPAVTIHLSLPAGTADEPRDLPGVASLSARMLDRGTVGRPAERIAEELDERGVALKCSAGRYSLALTATCLAADLPEVLDIVADVATAPLFPEDQLELRRREAITRLRQDEDNPFVRSLDAAVAGMYGACHPYGRPYKGTVAGLEQITREDLAAFHVRRFRPGRATLAIVGDTCPATALDWCEALFGRWRGDGADGPPPAAPAARGRRVLHEVMPGKAQADIAYGFTAVGRLDPRYLAYWIMNNILGEFGLGGRLAANIRERQGMAYYAFSSLDAAIGAAPLVARVGVDPADVPRAIEAIDAEVEGLGGGGPTADEVEQSRQYLIGSIPRMFETNQSTAAFLQIVERFGLGLDYADRLPGLLERVSVEDVAAAAADVLRPASATVVVAGPPEDA